MLKIKKEIRIPYVLDLVDVKAIHDFLESPVSVFSYIIASKDGAVRTFSSFEEFAEFDNDRQRQIGTLGINCFSKDFNKVYIGFLSSTIVCKIEGEEDSVNSLLKFLTKHLDSNRPWYSFLAGTYLKEFFIIFPLSMLFYIPIALKLPAISRENTTLYVLGTIGFCCIILAIQYLIAFLKHKFFPFGYFTIGDGMKRHKNKEIWRQVVIVAFFIGFAVNLFTFFLF
jgi:hypothetical protein